MTKLCGNLKNDMFNMEPKHVSGDKKVLYIRAV